MDQERILIDRPLSPVLEAAW